MFSFSQFLLKDKSSELAQDSFKKLVSRCSHDLSDHDLLWTLSNLHPVWINGQVYC